MYHQHSRSLVLQQPNGELRYAAVYPAALHFSETGIFTDGWDIYRSDHVTIRNSVVVNDDDCVCELDVSFHGSLKAWC